ncbi:MAG: hypothetical protein JNM65_13345 [Verrucomicrobiaceae bacterium]|nr:hypothetical protein [Verrucomicrobiaceae bacterium]
MRGFPPIQIFLLVLAFIVLAIPLGRLTGDAQAKPVVDVEGGEEQAVRSLLRLRYAHKPAALSLKIGGRELITSAQESPVEVDAMLPTPQDGVDVLVTATWPENTPDTAVTVEIEPDGLESRSETRWSAACSLDEVITFIWQ